MKGLLIHGTEINNIFELIGTDENSITKSIAWTFYQCPQLVVMLVQDLFGDTNTNIGSINITCQKYDRQTGITDIEITDGENFYIIIEAKRGLILPGMKQIERYSEREYFVKIPIPHKAIVSLSECSQAYASVRLPKKTSNGIPIKHVSWEKLYYVVCAVYMELNNRQKNLAGELKEYLRKIMTTQPQESNWVYVVSLSNEMFDADISWKDIVNKHSRYFHPVGNHWPSEPVNYIAFRYDGRLQYIHHVEKYEISDDLHNQLPVLQSKEEGYPLYVYSLGPAIIPSRIIKTGSIYRNGRVWAMLDTLLTSDTISEARDISKARIRNS